MNELNKLIADLVQCVRDEVMNTGSGNQNYHAAVRIRKEAEQRIREYVNALARS